MKSLKSILLAAGIALGTIGSAQAAPPEQQQQPMQQHELEEGYGFVRFVHASPNADVDQVFLTMTDGAQGGAAAAVTEFAQAGYTDMTEFVRLPEGTYDVMIALEGMEGEQLAQVVPADQLNVSSGGFYTLALVGLVTPGGEQAAQQQEQNGFFAWLQGLFTDDDGARGALGLQVLVLDEDATRWADQDEERQLLRVRIVHAAPGTETIELVQDRRQATAQAEADARDDAIEVLQAVSYGQVSDFAEVDAQEGQLAVRIEGMDEMFLDVAAQDFQPGMIHTVFVTGTPVEAAPLEGIVATTQPITEEQMQAQRDATAAEADAAAEPAEPAEAEMADEPAEPVEAEAAEEPADAAVETQVTPVQPAQPAAPAAAAPATTPAGTQDIAWVRFVDTSPNATAEQVLMTTGDGVGLTVEEFAGVEYMDATEYVAIPAGTYDVVVNATAQMDGQEGFALATPAASLAADAGNYYTIALMGLAVPADWAATEQRDEGFFAWLEGLFTADGPGEQELGLRTMLLHDDLAAFWADPAQETHIRLVHAAPGTESVELVLNQARATAADRRVDDVQSVDAAGYGDATGFNTVDTFAGALEVRIQGSDVVVLDLADFQLEPGMMHTIFITGTPVEDVPIEAVLITTAAVEGEPAPATQPAN